jgi:hypothetical protein
MVIGKMARGVKDGALALSAKAYLNDRFRDYGEVLDCRIDTGDNRLSVTALLSGEHEPITVTLERYVVEPEGGDSFLVLHDISSSREWIGRLLTRLFSGKRYRIPTAVSKLL